MTVQASSVTDASRDADASDNADVVSVSAFCVYIGWDTL